MGSGPKLFRVDPCKKETRRIAEIDFAQLGFQERRDIQEWIAASPSILEEGLLVIAKEFSGFDKTSERADLVAVDKDGNVVVIELKRDDTGADAYWQAIKYASYFQRAKPEDIVEMLATHAKISEGEAAERLKQHLDADDLSDLNRDQRVILASHRFAPEVMSAVVWLNQKVATEDMISCVELIPYRDGVHDSLYIQASTVLPISGVEDVIIGLSSIGSVRPVGVRQDDVTRFFKGVAATARRALPEELRPDKRSRWAGVGPVNRYYQIWYSMPPWGNQIMRYQLLLPKETRFAPYKVTMRFRCTKKEQTKRQRQNDAWLSEQQITALKEGLAARQVPSGQRVLIDDDQNLLLDECRTGDALDQAFRDSVVEMVRQFIETVTPVVKDVAQGEKEE